jgi:hypothetical protein
VTQTPLDSVPGDRIADTFRNHETQTCRPGWSLQSYKHQTSGAVTLALLQNPGEISRAAEWGQFRQRVASDLFGAAISGSIVRLDPACDDESHDVASVAEPLVGTSFS